MPVFSVKVIDGQGEGRVDAEMEPVLVTAPEDRPVLAQLLQREPIFHRPEFGCSRSEFERLAAPMFWEVGASGRRYSRQFVLDTLDKRHERPTTDVWAVQDPHCARIAEDVYLMTYTLHQGSRVTRRSTLWTRTQGHWQVLYHQGTEVAGSA